MRKPPIQAPTIAGAPGDQRQARRGARRSRARPSATGAAMPRPSVTLWTMKPTIRKVPSASSPSANDEPIASPSPRLCRPMPTATSVASAEPAERARASPPRRGARLGRERQAQVARAPRRAGPGPEPPSAPGSAACSSSASDERLDGEEGEQAAVSAMKAASQRGSARRSEGSQSMPERRRDHADSRPMSA